MLTKAFTHLLLGYRVQASCDSRSLLLKLLFGESGVEEACVCGLYGRECEIIAVFVHGSGIVYSTYSYSY
jgi:hypothetical protein